MQRQDAQSAAAEAAYVQSIELRHAAYRHQQRVKHSLSSFGTCRADGWESSVDEFEGEFDLDEPLGRALIASLIEADRSIVPRLLDWQSIGPEMRAPSARVAPRNWLLEYLVGEVQPRPAGNAQRLADETWNAALGAGNLAANATQAARAASLGLTQHSTRFILERGMQTITSGASKTVRINEFMELYDSNKGPKGTPPRPRIRLHGMPMESIRAAVAKPGVYQSKRSGGTSMRAAGLTDAERRALARAATEQARLTRASMLTGKVGTGVLTFAPSAAIDLYHSVETDLDTGRRQFDPKTFLIRSARSQSGNLAGFAVAILVPSAAGILGLALVGAPLVLVGLGAGIVAQVLFNSAGGNDLAEQRMRLMVGR